MSHAFHWRIGRDFDPDKVKDFGMNMSEWPLATVDKWSKNASLAVFNMQGKYLTSLYRNVYFKDGTLYNYILHEGDFFLFIDDTDPECLWYLEQLTAIMKTPLRLDYNQQYTDPKYILNMTVVNCK